MAYEISLLIVMGISITAGLSLNLITGFCGQISLGHAAFMGIGAYTSALMTIYGFPFFPSLAAGMLLAGIAGFFVGLSSLRVRHDFLAITTMGVGFLFIGLVRQQDALGGEMGISGIPDPGLGKIGFLLLVLGCAAMVILLCQFMKRSWLGFSFDVVADDEDTALLMGLNVTQFKLIAFAIGTCLAGLAGGLYAHNVRFIDPESFGFIESITVLSMVVIGGIGSVWGVVIASAVLSVLPLWFQFIEDYKLLVYGLLLFSVMRFSPGGLSAIFSKMFTRPLK
ncbi:MAG: branched-chain amino acid ABC transporter permease [SAR324 cluster bacterium]|nr:branched-chain amino acid ABC transporter permease [SAR324 cluster bacterium]